MLLRRIARPMLAAMFISGGIAALKAPQGHAQAAKPMLDAVAPAVDRAIEVAPLDQRPDDETLVRIDACVKLVAGSMLALGKAPRLASAALAASLVPTTFAAHRFWEITDSDEKQAQQIHFFKNVSLLGGLLIAAADTGGKPSLGWRRRRAARLAAAAASAQAVALTGKARKSRGRAGGAAASTRAAKAKRSLAGAGPEARARAADLQAELSRKAAKVARKAEKQATALQKEAARRSTELQKRAARKGAALQKAAERKREELERQAPRLAEQVTAHASRFGHDVAGRASKLGNEAAHQADGVAKDARKRLRALSR